MPTQIAPMLAVSDPDAAIDFYNRAFGAEVLWRIGEPTGVAGLAIHGAQFFLAQESPPSTHAPDATGTTVRIELFVDDPQAVYDRAITEGASEGNAVEEYTYATLGSRPTLRMLQGSVVDPSGHRWLIGKFLD